MEYPYSGIPYSALELLKKNEVDLFVLNFLQDTLLSENGTIQNSIHAICLKDNKNMLAYDQKNCRFT